MAYSTSKHESTFAVIFDMDGVIVDTNPYHRLALKEFCEKHGYHLSDDYLKAKIFGRTNADWLGELFQGNLSDKQLREYEEDKEQLFRDIYLPHIKPLDGLVKFLYHLNENLIPCAIATSAPKSNVDFILDQLQIRGFFQTIIHGNMIKRSKPHPEIYQKTVKILGLPARRVVVFEDSLSGVESALQAGCRVVGITTTHSREELRHTQMVINDFDHLSISELQKLI